MPYFALYMFELLADLLCPGESSKLLLADTSDINKKNMS